MCPLPHLTIIQIHKVNSNSVCNKNIKHPNIYCKQYHIKQWKQIYIYTHTHTFYILCVHFMYTLAKCNLFFNSPWCQDIVWTANFNDAVFVPTVICSKSVMNSLTLSTWREKIYQYWLALDHSHNAKLGSVWHLKWHVENDL